MNAWYCPNWFKGRRIIEGLEHINSAKAQGKGILLLGTHSTLLDAGGYICAQYFEPDVVYRPQNNPMLDMLIYRCRATIYQQQVDHDDMRGLVRRLKDGGAIVGIDPDQDFGLKQVSWRLFWCSCCHCYCTSSSIKNLQICCNQSIFIGVVIFLNQYKVLIELIENMQVKMNSCSFG